MNIAVGVRGNKNELPVNGKCECVGGICENDELHIASPIYFIRVLALNMCE